MEILAKTIRLSFAISFGLIAAFGQSVDEYQVKAAFLYNFSKFVEWPNLTAADTFNICILGDDPFGGLLDQLVKGKSAYNRRIEVRRLKDPAEARLCQIVFVRYGEDAKAARLIEAVRGIPVLTVSESRDFARLGGMIFLGTKEGHIGIGINAQAAEKSGLKVSAKLLSLAKNSMEESEDR